MRHPGNDALWIGLIVAAAVAGAVIIARSIRTGEDGTYDEVDEASADSFPASDAPSQTPVVGARTSGPRRR